MPLALVHIINKQVKLDLFCHSLMQADEKLQFPVTNCSRVVSQPQIREQMRLGSITIIVLGHIYTVRPRGTRPQAARTLQVHIFELGPKIFELNEFM